jgi:hypothetical protein
VPIHRPGPDESGQSAHRRSDLAPRGSAFATTGARPSRSKRGANLNRRYPTRPVANSSTGVGGPLAMTIFTRPQWCIEPLRPQPIRAMSSSRIRWPRLTDTGSESGGRAAAALLLAGFRRLANAGRIELPRGVLAVALRAFRAIRDFRRGGRTARRATKAGVRHSRRSVGTGTASVSRRVASLWSSSMPTSVISGMPKLANCWLGWSTVSHASPRLSSQITV